MRYLRYAFLALVGAILFTLAIANRAPVTLRLVTDDAASLLGIRNTIELPLFFVIFAALVSGILIGFVWEWFREYQYRAEASRKTKEAEALRKDLAKLNPGTEASSADDVLALLDNQKP